VRNRSIEACRRVRGRCSKVGGEDHTRRPWRCFVVCLSCCLVACCGCWNAKPKKRREQRKRPLFFGANLMAGNGSFLFLFWRSSSTYRIAGKTTNDNNPPLLHYYTLELPSTLCICWLSYHLATVATAVLHSRSNCLRQGAVSKANKGELGERRLAFLELLILVRRTHIHKHTQTHT